MNIIIRILICCVLTAPGLICGQGDPAADPVTIGNLNGEEVIVHVYRNKTDPFPFIEFSVVVDESSGFPRVELNEIQGGSTTGGFMIISGVRPAGEIGITQSATYEISFSRIGNYRIYEKAVMDYLRQLPIPEQVMEVDLEVEEILPNEAEETAPLDIVPIPVTIPEETVEDPEPVIPEPADVEEDPKPIIPEPAEETPAPDRDYAALRADTNSLLVHVHRDAEDIQPFKEFLLFTEEVNGEPQIRIVEVQGLHPEGQFIYMTGFTHTEEDGTRKSADYDMTPYNIEDYDEHVETVIEYMKRLSDKEFSGEIATIDKNWETLIAEPEPEPAAPKAPAFSPVIYNERRSKDKPVNAKAEEKRLQALEKGKYKPPKANKKYGSRKGKKMAERMGGKRNKTQCYQFKK